MDGWYYLHENGDLIYKQFKPEADSSFVRRVWSMDVSDRATAWTILLEAIALGARQSRVLELARKWGCDLADMLEYMCRCLSPTDLQQAGLRKMLEAWGLDYDRFMDAVAATPKGQQADLSMFSPAYQETP